MPLLYNYEFDIGEEIDVKVAFYDDTYDIIAAESLGQIDSISRRIWAQRSAVEMLKKPAMHFHELNSCRGDNPFVKRMIEEKWMNSLLCLTQTETSYFLQIYRSYLFIYLNKKYAYACEVNSLR